MKIQRDLLDFLMSPLGTKLSQNELNSFSSYKQEFELLYKINSVLFMIIKKLQNSKHFISQVDHLAKLYFISYLDNYE